MKNPSSKGRNYERQKAKELSLWWTEGERDDAIWLTSQSGGRATERYKKGNKTANQYGDLTFTDPIAEPLFKYFLFELKRGYTKEIDVLALLDSKGKNDPTILQWWKKAERDRSRGGQKHIALLLQRNRCEECLLLATQTIAELEEQNGMYLKNHLGIFLVDTNLIIIPYINFLEWCPPETIKELMKCQ